MLNVFVQKKVAKTRKILDVLTFYYFGDRFPTDNIYNIPDMSPCFTHFFAQAF